MACKKNNYNVIPLAVLLIVALGFMIPIFLVGMTFFIALVKVMFLSNISKGIPLWSIFLVGFAIYIIIKRT